MVGAGLEAWVPGWLPGWPVCPPPAGRASSVGPTTATPRCSPPAARPPQPLAALGSSGEPSLAPLPGSGWGTPPHGPCTASFRLPGVCTLGLTLSLVGEWVSGPRRPRVPGGASSARGPVRPPPQLPVRPSQRGPRTHASHGHWRGNELSFGRPLLQPLPLSTPAPRAAPHSQKLGVFPQVQRTLHPHPHPGPVSPRSGSTQGRWPRETRAPLPSQENARCQLPPPTTPWSTAHPLSEPPPLRPLLPAPNGIAPPERSGWRLRRLAGEAQRPGTWSEASAARRSPEEPAE